MKSQENMGDPKERNYLNSTAAAVTTTPYSVLQGAKQATEELKVLAGNQLPSEILRHIEDVTLTTATDGTQIYFPCPFKETEASVALKTIEASAVAAIADLRYGGEKKRRKIEINLEQTACFLFSTYIATIAGMGKQDPNVKSKLKGASPQPVFIFIFSAFLFFCDIAALDH